MVVHVIVQAIDGGIGYLPVEGVYSEEWICACTWLNGGEFFLPVEGVDGEEWICTC